MNPNQNTHTASASSLFSLQVEMVKKKESAPDKRHVPQYVPGGFSLKKRPYNVIQSIDKRIVDEEEREIEEKRQRSYVAMEEKTKRYNEIKQNSIYDEELLVQPDDDNVVKKNYDEKMSRMRDDDLLLESTFQGNFNHEDLYRDYGPCNYSFSKDEMLKGIQQNNLRQLSKETLDAREKAKEATIQRLRDTYERIVRLCERKKHPVVSFEEYVAENTQYYTSRNKNNLEDNVSSDDDVEKEIEINKSKKKREWDIGKELILH